VRVARALRAPLTCGALRRASFALAANRELLLLHAQPGAPDRYVCAPAADGIHPCGGDDAGSTALCELLRACPIGTVVQPRTSSATIDGDVSGRLLCGDAARRCLVGTEKSAKTYAERCAASCAPQP
jgi:hypothetical protein